MIYNKSGEDRTGDRVGEDRVGGERVAVLKQVEDRTYNVQRVLMHP